MIDLSRPLNLLSAEFSNNKFAIYQQLLADHPVTKAKISLVSFYTVARHEDCSALLNHPEVLRDRSAATGGSRFPFPLPKGIRALAQSMITEDDPKHRRLRELVRRAFRPQAIAMLEQDINNYSHQLLDALADRDGFDLQAEYALAIPVRMISNMMGISTPNMQEFQKGLGVLSDGMSGWRLLRTLFWDLPSTMRFVRGQIAAKRREPGDDILTGLINAEIDGDRLDEDEIVAMVFLLIVAGYETTVHLISNGVLTLLQHPDQLHRLRSDMTLIDSAVEEILRHSGPIHGTKPGYLSTELSFQGVTIPAGKMVIPLLGAANRDPRVFAEPDRFDISRSPNKHLAFGHGKHFCLGAHLARMETRIALRNLLERCPDLCLAVEPSTLTLQKLPLWHRYQNLPVSIKGNRGLLAA